MGDKEIDIKIKNSLSHVDLDTFGFVEREQQNGKRLANQCGRDFLYYVLNYYFPQLHNKFHLNPKEISKSGLFGFSWLPIWLIPTGLTFKKVPRYLKSFSLQLIINDRKINTYFDFLLSILPIRQMSFEAGIRKIEQSINDGCAVGVDIALALFGMVDHVMFVYGYDDENFYIFDTHQTRILEYEKLTPEADKRFIMKLPKSIIKKRWTIFSRIWIVCRV